MKSITLSVAAGAAMVAAGAVSASEPVSLTDVQLDGVSAGFFQIQLAGFATSAGVAGSTGGCPNPTQCAGVNVSGTATQDNSGALPQDNHGHVQTVAGSTWVGPGGTFSESGSASQSQAGWGLRLCGAVFGVPC